MLKQVLKHSLFLVVTATALAQTPGAARISSGVAAGNILTKVTPTYPAIARAAHMSGSVVLHAIIAKDGTIKSLSVISGPAMLQASSLDAVKQWTYKPYLLNGSPVEVDTQIVVNYDLGAPAAPAAATYATYKADQFLGANALIALANTGDPTASFFLGGHFRDGTGGVSKDAAQADALFQRALSAFRPSAEKGDPYSQYMMGRMTHFGAGTPQNDALAVAWFQKAADQGEAESLATLAHSYEHGLLGLTPDLDRARTLWRKAAETGDATAMTSYAQRLDNGSPAITQNKTEALAWYQKAAEKHSPNAEDSVARYYESGTVVAKDRSLALVWYQRAAADGNPASQVRLGQIYLNGDGVPQDNTAAFNFFQSAANLNFPFAYEWLGNMYRDGIAVPKNYDAARDLYKKALPADKDNATKLLAGLDTLQQQQASAQLAATQQAAAAAPPAAPPQAANAHRRAEPSGPANGSAVLHDGKTDAQLRIGHGNLIYRNPTLETLDLATVQQRAANKEDYEAQFELAVRLLLGEGIKKDKKAGLALIESCWVYNDRCSIAGGDLDGMSYCNLEPKEPCSGKYEHALKSDDQYLAAVAHNHLYSRVGGGAEALFGGIAGGLAAFNQAGGNGDGNASIQNTANQQTAAIQAKQQQVEAQQAAQRQAAAAQQQAQTQQAANQLAAQQRAQQLEAQQQAQREAQQRAAQLAAQQASANSCHAMNSIVHLQSEWFPYGPKSDQEVVGYITNNSTVAVTCTWAFHKNGQWTDVGTGYIKVGATRQGGQGGGIWTMGADSSDMRYACFEGSDPVGPDGKFCTTQVTFSGLPSAGTDLRDRK